MQNFIESHEAVTFRGTQAIIERHQEIPDDFLAGLRDERAVTKLRPGQQVNRVASIPEAIVNKWFREGFDVFRETNKAIVTRLRAEDLGVFVTARGV